MGNFWPKKIVQDGGDEEWVNGDEDLRRRIRRSCERWRRSRNRRKMKRSRNRWKMKRRRRRRRRS